MRLHQGRAALGSFEDALLVVAVTEVVFGVEVIGNLVLGPFINGLICVTAPVLAFAAMISARGFYRVLKDRTEQPPAVGELTPVVVVGAGDAGRQLITSMAHEPGNRWRPVALVDDDPLKRHRRIRGVPVLGRVEALPRVAEQVHATTVIIAIPTASAETIRTLSKIATDAGLEVKVLPGTSQLLNPARAAISDVRDINVTDLLGRHVIDTDVASIAGYLTDKRVLVTGAGGSIGSELCRQIARLRPGGADDARPRRVRPARCAAVDLRQGHAGPDDTILCDIRDSQFVVDLFERRRPEVVFHAAALKHLPLLESSPGEAVKTNVWGTLTILEAAAATGVERFVNISTDKAADPCSRAGLLEAAGRGADRGGSAERGGHLPQRPLRQRPGQPRLRADGLHRADRRRRPGHGHRPRRDPLLHDDRGGRPAGDPGRPRSVRTGRC